MKNIAEFYLAGVEWRVTDKCAELAERYYGGVDVNKLNQVISDKLGLIPSFMDGLPLDEKKPVSELVDHLEGRYGFPVNNYLENGGEISETGYYCAPSDPELAPLATAIVCGCFVFIYEYALVGVTDLETAFVGRFD